MTFDAIEAFVLRAALGDWLYAPSPNQLQAPAERICAELEGARLQPPDIALDAGDLHAVAVILRAYAPRPMPAPMLHELRALQRRIAGEADGQPARTGVD